MQKPKARGRPAVSDARRKSKNFTFRGTVDLHERLRLAALNADRSVSDEINYRLETSFDPDRDIEKLFSSRPMFALVRVMATAMQRAGLHATFLKTKSVEGNANWFRDPYSFAQAAKAAGKILEKVQPDGDQTAPTAFENVTTADFAKVVGTDVAEAILREIAGTLSGTLSGTEGADTAEFTGFTGHRLARDMDEQMFEKIRKEYGEAKS